MEEIRYVLQAADGRFVRGKDMDSDRLEWTASTRDALGYMSVKAAKWARAMLGLDQHAWVKRLTTTITSEADPVLKC